MSLHLPVLTPTEAWIGDKSAVMLLDWPGRGTRRFKLSISNMTLNHSATKQEGSVTRALPT